MGTETNHRMVRGALGYVGAVAVVGAALGIDKLLGPQVVGVEAMFFAAVALVAWSAGLGPSLVATAVAGFCSAWFFPDENGQNFGFDDLIRLAVFVAVAVLISSLHERVARRLAHTLRVRPA